MPPLPPPALKRLVSRGLLALLLLFAQQTASLHWLSHAVDATHAKASQGSAPSEHCDECLSITALGAAATAVVAAFVPAGVDHVRRPVPAAAPTRAALRLAFRSRAPPVRV